MHMDFRLVGYERKTEWLGITITIRPDKVDEVLAVVHAKVDEPDVGIGDWELTPEQSEQIGLIIGLPLEGGFLDYDYFLEPRVFAGEGSEA